MPAEKKHITLKIEISVNIAFNYCTRDVFGTFRSRLNLKSLLKMERLGLISVLKV